MMEVVNVTLRRVSDQSTVDDTLVHPIAQEIAGVPLAQKVADDFLDDSVDFLEELYGNGGRVTPVEPVFAGGFTTYDHKGRKQYNPNGYSGKNLDIKA